MTRRSRRELERAADRLDEVLGEAADVDEVLKDPAAIGEELQAIREDLDAEERRQVQEAVRAFPAAENVDEDLPAFRQLLDAVTGGPADHPAHHE